MNYETTPPYLRDQFTTCNLLACDFDIIYTILSSLSKNYMIKHEINIYKKKKEKKKNVWYELFWGSKVLGCWQELGLGPTS